MGKPSLPGILTPLRPLILTSVKRNQMQDLSSLRFEYDQYLLEWIDNGGEPMSFEEFLADLAA